MLQRIVSFFKLLSLVLLGGGVVLGLFWGFGQHFLPLESSKNILLISYKKDYQEGKTYLLQFVPTAAKIRVIALDETEAIDEVFGGYGRYRLNAIYPLLRLENKDTTYIQAAYSQAVSLSLDQVIVLLNRPVELEERAGLKKALRARLGLGNTPRDTLELMRLLFFTRLVEFENYSYLDQSVSTSNLQDETEPIYFESCAVAVVNTTPTSGLAGLFSGVIEHTGGRVVRVEDQDSPYQLTTISVADDDLNCLQVKHKVENLLPTTPIIKDLPDLRQSQRADLVLMLGQDVAREFEN